MREINLYELSEKYLSTQTITCPECGAVLQHESGCAICMTCGWSPCG